MRFWDHQENARSETRRLLLAFALAVALLVVAVHGALVLAWLLMALLLPVRLPFPEGFLVANVGVSLLLVLGGWWVETSNLRAGGIKFAWRIGAREARPAVSHDEQRLCNIVDELCIAAHMQRPQVMVLPGADAINAFAAGWDEADAVVAVTQGALDHLTRDELQGMVAHELSHLHEGDTRLKMRLAGMVFGLELVYNFGDEVRERGGLATLFGSAIMLAGFAGWFTGRLLKAAVSRQREYLADARAVQWTRSKDGLGGVLRKVMAQRHATPAGYELRGHTGLAHPAVQHMLLVEAPCKGRQGVFRTSSVESENRPQRGQFSPDLQPHSRAMGQETGEKWTAAVDLQPTISKSERCPVHWLDTHPRLSERVQRIYGRSMQPLPLTPVNEAPEPARRQEVPVPGVQSLASRLDPFARL